MTWAQITSPGTTTSSKFYGDVMNKISQLFTGATYADVDTVDINSTWKTRASKFTIVDVTDITKVIKFDPSGATAGKTLTLISSHTNDRSITFPDGGTTLAGLNIASTWLQKQIFTAGLLQSRDILDSNANKIVDLIATTSSVDFFEFTDAATAGHQLLLSAKGTDTNIGITLVPKGTGEIFGHTEILTFAVGDESTNKVAGTYFTWVAPRAGQIIWVEQGCTVAPTTAAVTLDVDIGGTSIFSTKPTIAAGATSGSNGILTNNPQTVAKGDIITFEVDTNDTGTTSAGIKITLGFRRTA